MPCYLTSAYYLPTFIFAKGFVLIIRRSLYALLFPCASSSFVHLTFPVFALMKTCPHVMPYRRRIFSWALPGALITCASSVLRLWTSNSGGAIAVLEPICVSEITTNIEPLTPLPSPRHQALQIARRSVPEHHLKCLHFVSHRHTPPSPVARSHSHLLGW